MRSDWYWIRQGAVAQDPGRYAGRLDLPTLPPDAVIARKLRARLPNGAVWLTSPLSRARASVAALDEAANAIAVGDFTEQELGSWGGRRRTEVHKANPQIDWSELAHIVPEGGEGFGDVVVRVAEGIERLTQHYPDRPFVVVTHSVVIRAALVLALDLPNSAAFAFDVGPFSLTHLSWEGPEEVGAHTDERVGLWRAHTINSCVV